MHIATPSISSVMNQNPSWRFSPLRHTETTIANLPARRTHPFPVPQRISKSFPVSILQTGGTKLSPYPPAVLVVANCLDVNCFLPTLVAGGASNAIIYLVWASVDHFDVSCWGETCHIVQFYGEVIFCGYMPPTRLGKITNWVSSWEKKTQYVQE